MLAAAMQTCSAALNSTATLVAYDLFKRHKPDLDDHALVVIGKWTTVTGTILAIVASPLFGHYTTIFEGINKIISYVAPPITAVFLLGVFWKRATNAGALAAVDVGTALAPMRVAKEQGRKFFVYVSETRPRLQGARLTAWELLQEGIEHAILTDSASGHFMSRGEVDLVLVGADRIAANGDTANKIGTYMKAVVAKEHGVPFYVAAPTSTIDLTIPTGSKIPIEERSPQEVLQFAGNPVAPKESPARNPAFDVTPAKYIRGIITEAGILRPSDLKKLGKPAPTQRRKPATKRRR
jgi:hypothetical protein